MLTCILHVIYCLYTVLPDSVHNPAGGTLNPPTNLMSSSVMATSLVVSWTASTSSSVTGYYISWSRTDLGGIAVGEYAQTTNVTYTITNLFSGVSYNISVWSTDGTRVSSPATLPVTTTETGEL